MLQEFLHVSGDRQGQTRCTCWGSISRTRVPRRSVAVSAIAAAWLLRDVSVELGRWNFARCYRLHGNRGP